MLKTAIPRLARAGSQASKNTDSFRSIYSNLPRPEQKPGKVVIFCGEEYDIKSPQFFHSLVRNIGEIIGHKKLTAGLSGVDHTNDIRDIPALLKKASENDLLTKFVLESITKEYAKGDQKCREKVPFPPPYHLLSPAIVELVTECGHAVSVKPEHQAIARLELSFLVQKGIVDSIFSQSSRWLSKSNIPVKGIGVEGSHIVEDRKAISIAENIKEQASAENNVVAFVTPDIVSKVTRSLNIRGIKPIIIKEVHVPDKLDGHLVDFRTISPVEAAGKLAQMIKADLLQKKDKGSSLGRF